MSSEAVRVVLCAGQGQSEGGVQLIQTADTAVLVNAGCAALPSGSDPSYSEVIDLSAATPRFLILTCSCAMHMGGLPQLLLNRPDLILISTESILSAATSALAASKIAPPSIKVIEEGSVDWDLGAVSVVQDRGNSFLLGVTYRSNRLQFACHADVLPWSVSSGEGLKTARDRRDSSQGASIKEHRDLLDVLFVEPFSSRDRQTTATDLGARLMDYGPLHVVPVGSDWPQLQEVASQARGAGFRDESVLLGENGDVLDIARHLVFTIANLIETLDGNESENVADSPRPADERSRMRVEGVVSISLALDAYSGAALGGPVVELRGVDAPSYLEETCQSLIRRELADWRNGDSHRHAELEDRIVNTAGSWFVTVHGVSPLIVCSVVMVE